MQVGCLFIAATWEQLAGAGKSRLRQRLFQNMTPSSICIAIGEGEDVLEQRLARSDRETEAHVVPHKVRTLILSQLCHVISPQTQHAHFRRPLRKPRQQRNMQEATR